MIMSRSAVSFVIIGLLATGLAGCFSQPAAAAEPSLSRTYAAHIGPDNEAALRDASTPDDVIRAILETTLVVRAPGAGVYTLRYSDEAGTAREATVTLAPGVPHEQKKVDAFGAASLVDATGKIVLSRDAIPRDWWKVGAVPLGVGGSSGAVTYAMDLDARASLRVTEASVSDQQLDRFVLSLQLPLTGESSITLGALTAGETPITLRGAMSASDPDGSVLLVDADGTREGAPWTFGVDVPRLNAAVDGGATMWLRDGQLIAGRADAGSVRFEPDIFLWSTGESNMGPVGDCGGATREQRCTPSDRPKVNEIMNATEREDFRNVPSGEGTEEQQAIRLMQRLFAQDLALHDRFTFTARDSEKDRYDITFEFDIQVVDRAPVNVGAGTYDAWKLVATMRTKADLKDFGPSRTSCSAQGYETYEEPTPMTPQPTPTPTSAPTSETPPPPPPTQPTAAPTPAMPPMECHTEMSTLIKDLQRDDTILRGTMWLHATRFVPLLVEVDSPLDVQGLTRSFISSSRSGSGGMDLTGVKAENVIFSAGATSTASAKRLAGDIHVAPATGILLASSVAGVGFLGPMFGMMVPTRGYSSDMPDHAVPSGYISLEGEPIDNGTFTATVRGVGPDMRWGDLSFEVNGQPFRQHDAAGECATPDDGTLIVCRDGLQLSPDNVIMPSDNVSIGGVTSGDTLGVIHMPTRSMMLMMSMN